MKNQIRTAFVITVIMMASCKKDDFTPHSLGPIAGYSNVAEFLASNAPAMQQFSINASTGGNFTTPQGTQVVIPANAFVTQSNQPVTGNVTISFKDIYHKSDMLFSNMPTQAPDGSPMKSGGEFYIKAVQNNQTLNLASGQHIDVRQPITGNPDYGMIAFTNTQNAGWVPAANNNAVVDSASFSYVYSMYNFQSPVDSGSWCNSDNATFFSAYQQTGLNITSNDLVTNSSADVFLLFSSLNSMVHVYYSNNNQFIYNYAPVGLSCTAVFIQIRNGQLFSSFTPITITSNLSVTLNSAQHTTEADFKTALNALN